MRRPSGDTRGCSSSSGDCVSRSGMRSGSGPVGSTRNRSHCSSSAARCANTMRPSGVQEGVRSSPSRSSTRSGIRAPRVRQIEIESVAAICDKDDPFAVGGPCGLAFGLDDPCELPRVATVGRGGPDPIEDHDGQTLAVGRPCRDRASRKDQSAHSGRAPARTAGSLWPAGGLHWRVARRCVQAALPSRGALISHGPPGYRRLGREWSL